MAIFGNVLDAHSRGGVSWRRHGWSFVAQSVLSTAAIGCYEVFATFQLFGYCAFFIWHLRRSSAVGFDVILFANAYAALVVGLSTISYMLVTSALYDVLEATNYAAGYIDVGKLFNSPITVISEAAYQYFLVYFGHSFVYGFAYPNFIFIILLGLVAIALEKRHLCNFSRLYLVLYLVGMTFLPFVLTLATGGMLPFRTLVTVPLRVLVLCGSCGLQSFSPGPAGRSRIERGHGTAVALHLFGVSAARRLAFAHDVQLASRLYARIVEKFPSSTARNSTRSMSSAATRMRQLIRRYIPRPGRHLVFAWENGNNWRINPSCTSWAIRISGRWGWTFKRASFP